MYLLASHSVKHLYESTVQWVSVRIWKVISGVQSQKAVSAYFTSEQILPFGFEAELWSVTHV